MSEQDRGRQILGKAYRAFVEQLDGQLNLVHTTFDASSVDPDQVKKASEVFHTIKGGAGFFGLQNVADIAADIEGRLNDPQLDLIRGVERVRELIMQLERIAQNLPKEPKV